VLKGPSNPEKDQAAVSLGRRGGKRRAEKLTPPQRSEIAKMGGLVGGKARASKLTKAQRSEIAKKAAEARWKKAKEA
jgi:hypothetical protein